MSETVTAPQQPSLLEMVKYHDAHFESHMGRLAENCETVDGIWHTMEAMRALHGMIWELTKARTK